MPIMMWQPGCECCCPDCQNFQVSSDISGWDQITGSWSKHTGFSGGYMASNYFYTADQNALIVSREETPNHEQRAIIYRVVPVITQAGESLVTRCVFCYRDPNNYLFVETEHTPLSYVSKLYERIAGSENLIGANWAPIPPTWISPYTEAHCLSVVGSSIYWHIGTYPFTQYVWQKDSGTISNPATLGGKLGYATGLISCVGPFPQWQCSEAAAFLVPPLLDTADRKCPHCHACQYLDTNTAPLSVNATLLGVANGTCSNCSDLESTFVLDNFGISCTWRLGSLYSYVNCGTPTPPTSTMFAAIQLTINPVALTPAGDEFELYIQLSLQALEAGVLKTAVWRKTVVATCPTIFNIGGSPRNGWWDARQLDGLVLPFVSSNITLCDLSGTTGTLSL